MLSASLHGGMIDQKVGSLPLSIITPLIPGAQKKFSGIVYAFEVEGVSGSWKKFFSFLLRPEE